MSETLPKIAGLKSAKISVTTGTQYWWCSCGLSQNQPFCDGSHKETGFSPVLYTAKADGIIGFCLCKQSEKEGGVICDGKHKTFIQNIESLS
jgi:CDGSH-type Zn-finger protein